MNNASLRNAVKRKTHKERGQPSERGRYGLLEKHKDYKLRAKDFHRKEDAIKVLRNKAALRNPDEFYFAMEKARTKDGVHLARSTDARTYTADELRLMKTQDLTYVVHKAQVEAKKVERLAASLHFVGAQPTGTRTVFVDEGEEALAILPRAVGRASDPLRAQQQSDSEDDSDADDRDGDAAEPAAPAASKAARGAHRELQQRRERAAKLKAITQEMMHAKAAMGKGHKRKLPGAPGEPGQQQPAQFKWKTQRKK